MAGFWSKLSAGSSKLICSSHENMQIGGEKATDAR